MANHARISAEVVEQIEGVMDALQEAHTNDGQVTADEVLTVMDLLWTAYQTSMHADQGVRLSVTALRRGAMSGDLHRQVREIAQEQQRSIDTRPRLQLIRGGKDRHEDTPQDAA